MEERIRAEDLAVTLGGKKVLEGISFTVKAGELTGIIGPNGAGKTTLLRSFLGLVPIRGGKLTLLGASLAKLKEVRSRVGYMPQRQSFERRFPLSVSDVVGIGLLSPDLLLRRVAGRKEQISAALQAVGMTGYTNRSFQDLSGGEQQRILLARSLVKTPDLLLLDEPNAGLDYPAQQGFMQLIQKLKQEQGLTIILVSHDLVSVASAADQLVCINKTMHVHGCPSEVMNSSRLDAAYRCQYDYLSKGEQGGTGFE